MEKAAWKIFDAPSLKMMPSVQEKQIFMIHEYQLGMPARIEEKGIVIEPASMEMATLSKALPNPPAKGPPVDKQEVKKGRRNKRNKQKKNKGKGTTKPATFQLPLRYRI
ncbi:hypothetical protein KCU61_g522, partial [Aureobasidium melanogenum]